MIVMALFSHRKTKNEKYNKKNEDGRQWKLILVLIPNLTSDERGLEFCGGDFRIWE